MVSTSQLQKPSIGNPLLKKQGNGSLTLRTVHVGSRELATLEFGYSCTNSAEYWSMHMTLFLVIDSRVGESHWLMFSYSSSHLFWMFSTPAKNCGLVRWKEPGLKFEPRRHVLILTRQDNNKMINSLYAWLIWNIAFRNKHWPLTLLLYQLHVSIPSKKCRVLAEYIVHYVLMKKCWRVKLKGFDHTQVAKLFYLSFPCT